MLHESPYQNFPVYKNYKGFSDNCPIIIYSVHILFKVTNLLNGERNSQIEFKILIFLQNSHFRRELVDVKENQKVQKKPTIGGQNIALFVVEMLDIVHNRIFRGSYRYNLLHMLSKEEENFKKIEFVCLVGCFSAKIENNIQKTCMLI